MRLIRKRIHGASRAALMRLSLPLLLSIFAGVNPPVANAAPGKPLQAEMASRLQAEGLPGAVWTLVRPDGGNLTGAAGMKAIRSAQAMTPETRVHVGSVAKTVLAIGVLHLVTDGKLTLDTEVAALLPGMKFDNPWQASDPIRIRHLLEHTAGVENFRFSQAFSLHARADTPLIDAFGHTPSLTVRSRPGARYAYSTIGYHLLGMIIEVVTGTRYEAYLDAELLRPLGMHDSTFAFTRQTGADADPRLAMGYFEDGVAQSAVPIYTRPAVQFTTTAADMGRLAQFLMGNGRAGGKVLIAPALLAALGGGHGTDAARAGLTVGHGLALATRDRHQVIGNCHPGTTIGFQAMFCLYPQERKAFFVAVNADVETAD
jgi:CubicO group peptidase (beta-lactamase class C family)